MHAVTKMADLTKFCQTEWMFMELTILAIFFSNVGKMLTQQFLGNLDVPVCKHDTFLCQHHCHPVGNVAFAFYDGFLVHSWTLDKLNFQISFWPSFWCMFLFWILFLFFFAIVSPRTPLLYSCHHVCAFQLMATEANDSFWQYHLH